MRRFMVPGIVMVLTLLLGLWNSLPALQDSENSAKAPPKGEPAGQTDRQAGGQQAQAEDRAFGTITSVGVDRFQIKTRDDSVQTVLVDEQTRYRQGQKDLALDDLKAGDMVFVRGRVAASKGITAAMVRRVTPEDMQRFQNSGDRAFGEITSIDPNQLKIRNPFRGEKIVVVNDQTTFRKDGQPITLQDLKVGDRIFAQGRETNGQFVATRVFSGQLRRQEGDARRWRQAPPDSDSH